MNRYHITNTTTGNNYSITDGDLAAKGATLDQWLERKVNAYGHTPTVTIEDMSDEVIEQQRKVLQVQRDEALASITATVNGKTVQVRPQDAQNFQVAISLGESQDWILADNTVGTLTVQDMQDALTSGIAQARDIWAAYTGHIRTLNGG